MADKPKQDYLLFALLGGGILFVLAAIGVVGALFLLTPKEENEAPPAMAEAPPPPADAAPPTGTPPPATATPTPTSAPSTNTPTPAPLTGDKLALPTKTPTITPTPPATPTPTPVPPTAPPHTVTGVAVGKQAPDFTLGSNLFNRVSLSDLRGKVVVLNFWATWCPPCRREVPNLQAVHNEYGPRGVVVLAVDVKENLDTVGGFAMDNGITFNVWLDEDGWASNIYGVRSLPTTFFIDRQGIIRSIHFGAMSREQISAQLEKMF